VFALLVLGRQHPQTCCLQWYWLLGRRPSRCMEKQARGPDPLSGHVSSAAQTHGQQHDPASAGEVQQRTAGAQHAAGRKQLYDDHFMMWVWKVEMCKRVDTHDRQSCPYAHPGELARRRHPSLYQALPCPEARAVSQAHPLLLCRSCWCCIVHSTVAPAQQQGLRILDAFFLCWGARLVVLGSRQGSTNR
jgi:hypothetical protein